MSRLTTVGSDLSAGWSAASSVINSAVGQLGRGPLGVAFLVGYQQHATEVAAAATRCCQSIDQLATAGNGSVTTYEATETDAQNIQRSVSDVSPL